MLSDGLLNISFSKAELLSLFMLLINCLMEQVTVAMRRTNRQTTDKLAKDLFLTFHCFCTRKDIHSLDVVLEDSDVVKALTEYVSYAAIEKLILGAPSRSGFMRKFRTDIPSCVAKATPDFCTVYVISKGKVSSVKNAVRAAPFTSPLLDQIKQQPTTPTQGFSMSNPSAVKAGLFPFYTNVLSGLYLHYAVDNRSAGPKLRTSIDCNPRSVKSPYKSQSHESIRGFIRIRYRYIVCQLGQTKHRS